MVSTGTGGKILVAVSCLFMLYYTVWVLITVGPRHNVFVGE
jgi:hypothetical protein